MLPSATAVAPRNVRPLVRLLVGGGAAPCSAPPCAVDVVELELRTAPGPDRAPRTIPIETIEARSGDVATYRITPRAELDANRRYEVLAVLDAKPGALPRERRLLGTFRTGATFDTARPTWTGIRSLELVPWRPQPTGSRGKGTIRIAFGPQPLRTYADIWGRTALDAETPADLVTYAVRIADASGRVDHASMPRGYFRGAIDLDPADRSPDRLFWLGQVNECFAHTFDFPEHGKLTIGVTAVDLAGNESPMFVHTLDLDAP